MLQVGSSVGSRWMVAATLKPCLATGSDRPFTCATGLITERSGKLDERFAHRGLVSNAVVNLGGVLSVVCTLSARSFWWWRKRRTDGAVCGEW